MHAVFYRNMNLGHRGSPTREQIEESLRIAGAKRVRSFQTNGTVLLETDEPESVVRTAAKPLFLCAGYDGVAVIRTISSLRSTLTVDYFRGQTDQRTYKETFTFFDGVQQFTWTLPWTNKRDDVDVIHVDNGVALGIIRKNKSSIGNVTAVIEKEICGVATTRTRGTIECLVRLADNW